VAKEREARGLAKRGFQDVLNTNHDKTSLGYTPETGSDIIFGNNASCVLTPQVTEGPYCMQLKSFISCLFCSSCGI
jgi:hypothetical protein